MALTQVDQGLLGTYAQYTGFKSRIINGAMMVSQRGTSFSTPATGSYTLDRWQVVWGGAAPASVAQVVGPSGFKNALQITGAASNTITYIVQKIESANCSDLSGVTVTIQANIAVSSAQTIAWNLNYANAADNFSSVTGITSGTWSATTTATTFTATITNLPSGAVNGLQLGIYANNAGAFTSGTVTITGVQLEKGSTATSFDYRPYGTELQLCQRYFQAITPRGNSGGAQSTNSGMFFVPFITGMRAAPTTAVNGTIIVDDIFSTTVTSTLLTGANTNTTSLQLILGSFSPTIPGIPRPMQIPASNIAVILFSAEL